MARQLPLTLVVFAACREEVPYGGAFDVPVAAAVLQPEVGGPFQEPVGFVANGHGGQIVQLALKQGRFLTDDPTVSFLRTNPLATGGDRILTSVAVRAPSIAEVVVWAGDRRFGQLLRLPWLHDCATLAVPECDGAPAGAPIEQESSFEIVETVGDARLDDVHTKDGYTTTETWTVAFDGEAWSVEGSRSGREAERPVPGRPYSTESRRLNFTIAQGDRAVAGDRFVIETRNGLTEHDVGGAPLALLTSPDQSLLAMVVHDLVIDRPFVRWFDPAAATVVGQVALPAEASPHRLAWSLDGALLVADRTWPAVWEVALGETVAIEHPTPWPTLDVTAFDGADGRRRLYVVPLDGSALWPMDRDTDALIDVNATVPGDQGMAFDIPVLGIEALPLPYQMPEYTEDLIRVTARSVAVVLGDATVVFAHEETGCLVQDALGPRTVASSGLAGTDDYEASFENVLGPATLEQDGASGRHVLVNACAGLARPEEWELRFDQNVQAWRVEGSVSGVQQALAIEDQRYLSDRGEVSFTVRAGSTPSRDGWTIRFTVDAGVARATGDNDEDGVRDVSLGVAADPVAFFYRVGLPGRVGEVEEGSGWYPVDVRPLALVPGASTNEVARVDPQRASLEVGWE